VRNVRREGPQLKNLHPPRERVGQIAQGKDLSGTGEPQRAGARVGINRHLDRPEELGRELDFVDDEEPVVVDESGRVVARRTQRGRVVE
jgi:hypothetical protein